jgi:tRNA threonylcarbamoyladenosine biosynthesis protein TsaB
VTTLEAVAHGVPQATRAGSKLLVALDSKREDIYVQLFDETLDALTEPAAVMADALTDLTGDGPVTVVGDAAGRAVDALSREHGDVRRADAPGIPDASRVGEIALARALPSAGDLPAPIYLRPPDAVRPKHGGRLRP